VSKNDKIYLLLKEIRDLEIKRNEKLDRLLILGASLADSMSEEMYIRNRETSPEIFNPKFYEDE